MTFSISEFSGLSAKLALATDPETPTDVLGRLILDENPAVSQAVADNPSTPLWALLEAVMLKGVFEGYNPPLRGIAAHPNASPELLEQLAASDNHVVRSNVGGNHNASQDTLRALSADSEISVRIAVARNPNTATQTLESLSAKWGGSEVAKNPRATRQCLLILLANGHEEDVAQRRDVPLSLLAPLARHKKVGIRKIVAAHPAIDEKSLSILACDTSAAVREAVASNEKCPKTAFFTLARDSEQGVLAALASNPSCPIDVLQYLAFEGAIEIRLAIIENPSCPAGLSAVLRYWSSLRESGNLPPRPELPVTVENL